MKENSQPTDILRLIDNLNAPHTPGDDCAGTDTDYDTFTDDELELRNGLYRHALAHGEVVNG